MRLDKIIPKHGIITAAIVFFYNLAVYFITSYAVSDSARHTFSFALDNKLPFLPVFSLFYVLAFAQWGVNWLMIGRSDKETCYRLLRADLIAKTICLVVFIAYPTAIVRPEVTSNGFFSDLTRLIYTIDKPVNCLPSIHILGSYIAVRAAYIMDTPKAYKTVHIVLLILCIMATLLIKQHYLIDIPAGIIVTEIGLALAKGKTK